MIRWEIKNLIEKAIKELQKEAVFPKFEAPEIKIERPEEKTRGDYSTNAAMVIGKILKQSPLEVAEKLAYKIQDTKYPVVEQVHYGASKILERVEVVKPGFINFFLSEEYLQKQINEILKQGENFGQLKIGKKQKINIEFISANPTGPLHIGNGRGGFCGDALSNVLGKAGYKVFREYYVNNMGRQVEVLQNSLEGKEPSYPGAHIEDLKNRKVKDSKEAIEIILKEYIEPTVEKMGIKIDRWFFESELYKKKEIDKILRFLKKKNLTYEKEDALWFKSVEFGDDKDRVLKKKDDKETYFLSDIAYLNNKFKRNFDYLIIFLGAEHHGYVSRLKAAAKALGYNPERVKPIIMQLVKLAEKGKEIKMSKRSGIYVTIDELIGEVGKDAARFFFLTRSPGSHLVFDLDLAKEQSEKNPVYYAQYAHARICSIIRRADTKYPPDFAWTKSRRAGKIRDTKYKLLDHPAELNLIKQLIRLPEIIEDTTMDYQVQRLPQYATDLATAFHQFYRDCRVLSETRSLSDLSEARLGLILATKIVLKNTLDLMGISAPEKM